MSDTKTPPNHLSDAFNAMFSDGGFVASVGSARPKAAQLDKRAATLTPPVSRGGEVVGRWRLKHTVSSLLRDASEDDHTPGVCKCGMSGRDRESVDLVLRSGNKPGVNGVIFCDSPWLCPSCAPKRAGERVDRISNVFDAAEAKGGTVVFVTLTVRHERGQSLADLKKMVQSACADARRGAPWERAKKRFNIVGVISSPEVTYGDKTGWHFHLHIALVLLPFEGEMIEPKTSVERGQQAKKLVERGQQAGEWLIDRYMNYIRLMGGSCDRKGQDVQSLIRRDDLAKYVAKGSADWEIASAGATKLGIKGNTPWDLAARSARGDHVAAGLFKEYAAVMPGTRSCVVSAKLAAILGIQSADDSENPSVQEVESDDVKIMELATSKWNRLLRRGCAHDVLNAVAAKRTPKDIFELVSRLLHETASGDDGWTGAKADLSVSALVLAERARVIKKGRRVCTTSGAALQIAVQEWRDKAARKKQVLILPDLKTTMALLVDDVTLAA